MLNIRVTEAGLSHPQSTICPSVIETTPCFNQHIQAHQQTSGVFLASIINDGLISNESAVTWQAHGMRNELYLSNEMALDGPSLHP